MAEGEIIDVDGGITEEGIRIVQEGIQEGIMAEGDTIDTTNQEELSEEGGAIILVQDTRTDEEEDIRTGIKIGINIGTEDGTDETDQTGAEDPSETTPTKGVKK